MTTIQKNVPSEGVRQGARHVLFVEGNDDSALDPQVLSQLLPMVQVKALGASFHIQSAAEALCKHHSTYYFLIDRDHHDDGFVRECWDNFPDPSKSNLLVWPRRELENYFIIPEYLELSQYLVKPKKPRECIREQCQQRLFLDITNLVIVSLREDLKRNWIKLFDGVEGFGSRDEALRNLKAMPELREKKKSTSSVLGLREVERRFCERLQKATGGEDGLEFGRGLWLEMVRGKKILDTLLRECFRVKDAQGKSLQGRERLLEMAKDLLRKDLKDQPEDLRRLREIIADRVGAP